MHSCSKILHLIFELARHSERWLNQLECSDFLKQRPDYYEKILEKDGQLKRALEEGITEGKEWQKIK